MKKLIVFAVALAVLAIAPQKANAAVQGQLKGSSLKLGTALGGQTTTHTFAFTAATTASIKAIRFQYCTKPSSATGCTAPAGMDSGTVNGTNTGLTGTYTAAQEVAGRVLYSGADGGQVTKDTGVVSVVLSNMHNPAIGACNPATANSSDTCYVVVTTYSAVGATTADEVDQTILSFTLVQDVTVTARVDPTFTFVIDGVNSGIVNNAITTSVSSAFNTLPFGNLTAGTPKYAAHKLNVTTNTQGGYTVDSTVTTQLTGVYSVNNIDAFTANWNTPAAWTSPTGNSPSVDTGWFGANTTDTDVTGWETAASPNGKFGGLPTNTARTVMKATSSDNGSTAVYVTYAIEANVYQPADTYTGHLNYNALPVY